MSCCTYDLETEFDEQVAARDLRAYRSRGLPTVTRRLVDALVAEGVEGRTLLDIGGGVGAIHHALLDAGLASVTDVDGSSAYLSAARQEAQRQGHADRITYRHGDFVQLADEVEPADIVTLIAVLCCYPQMESLVRLRQLALGTSTGWSTLVARGGCGPQPRRSVSCARSLARAPASSTPNAMSMPPSRRPLCSRSRT
jgi:hypothetical protein